MGVPRAEEPVSVTFSLGDQRFTVSMRRGQIIHEAMHAALPSEVTTGHRLTFRGQDGTELFADNFLGDVMDHTGGTDIFTRAEAIPHTSGTWRNVGFDHLAITVADRPAMRDFLRDVLQMQVMRDDAHLTVLAAGMTALFLFDAGQEAPLSPGTPSSWHHIGFVVDDLEAAYDHLLRHQALLRSDFTLLERDERWSLYGFYRNGDVTLMFQLSEIKLEWRSRLAESASSMSLMYDYTSRPYGVQWDEMAK